MPWLFIALFMLSVIPTWASLIDDPLRDAPLLLDQRYWGTWTRSRTLLLQPDSSLPTFCTCWDVAKASTAEAKLRNALCSSVPRDSGLPLAGTGKCRALDGSMDETVFANGRLFPAAQGKFMYRAEGNFTEDSNTKAHAGLTTPEWEAALSLVLGDTVGSWRLRTFRFHGKGFPTQGVLSAGASVMLVSTSAKEAVNSIRDPIQHFKQRFNATFNVTAPKGVNSTNVTVAATPAPTVPEASKPIADQFIGKAMSFGERTTLTDCVAISYVQGTRGYLDSISGKEEALSRDEYLSRVERGVITRSPAVEFALGLLCNTTDTLPSHRNWTVHFSVFQGRSDHDFEQQQRGVESVAMVCFAIAAVIGARGFCDIGGSLHNSTGAQGKVSFGTMAWLLGTCTFWFAFFCTIPGWRSVNLRGYLPVFALLYLVTNAIQVNNTLVVRRAHLALRIPSLASLTFWQACFFGIVAFTVLVEFGAYLAAPYLAVPLNSLFVPQLWHNIAEGHSPGISIKAATHLAVAQVVFMIPFVMGPSNVFLMDTNWLSIVGSGIWLAVQITLLRQQERFGSTSIIPPLLRPKRHDYNVAATDLRALEDPECSICRCGLLEDDESRGSAEAEIWRTPCGHIFHRECLQRWLEERFECPLCRSRLPKP